MAKLLLGSVVGPQGPQGTPGVNGSQGPQGIPGPSEIAATTNVVGLTTGQLLYNNGGKVGSVEIVDNLLSVNPNKPLSANQGKVLKGLIDDNGSAIGQKADKTQLSNPNLLINGDFQIWQRGVSFGVIPANSYTADRWNNSGGSSLTEKTISGIKHITAPTSSGLLQIIEDFDGKLSNKVVTISVMMKASTQIRLEVNGVSSNPLSCSDYTLLKLTTNIGTILNGKLPIRIRNAEFGVSTFEIKYAKLEIGEIATPLSPRSYAEELAMCQRYYQLIPRIRIKTDRAPLDQKSPYNLPVVMRTTPTISYTGGDSIAFIETDYCENHILLSIMTTNTLIDRTFTNVKLDAEIY